MQLTISSMSDNPIIPEINHQQPDDDDENNDNNKIEQTDNSRHLLNTASSSKNTKLSSRSPSPSPRPTSSAPPDRALNQKFHVAALTGNLNILQELVTKAHIPIDCRDRENSTALLLSCARGHYSCAEYLLTNGADPNARRLTGASPLYFATSYHHTRIVELLLNKYKAVVDLSTFDGSASLHVASEHGFTDIVQLLINSQVNINAKMNDGTTAIMLACQNGHLSIVQMLVSTGQCNLSIQRLDGVTPLFLVVQHGHEAVFDYLVEKVENIKDTIDLAREDGATPLFKACQKGYDALVNKLLKFKPNLELLKSGESVCRRNFYKSNNSFLFLVFTCSNYV
jgi:ankyrin repeat protein